MQPPTLVLEDRRAEDVPFDGILGLLEAATVAQYSNCNIVRCAGVMQRQVDQETLIAPVNIAADFVRSGPFRRQSLRK
jgi:hypothetical protein